jgi:hypothetical protein
VVWRSVQEAASLGAGDASRRPTCHLLLFEGLKVEVAPTGWTDEKIKQAASHRVPYQAGRGWAPTAALSLSVANRFTSIESPARR